MVSTLGSGTFPLLSQPSGCKLVKDLLHIGIKKDALQHVCRQRIKASIARRDRSYNVLIGLFPWDTYSHDMFHKLYVKLQKRDL
jgi:hypothetical protein